MKHSKDAVTNAAEYMDWTQPLLNGSPPCFFLSADGHFCGRAKRWHQHENVHSFVSLAELLGAAIESGKRWEEDVHAICNALGVKSGVEEVDNCADEACERIAVYKEIATSVAALGNCFCGEGDDVCEYCLAVKITKDNPAKTEDEHLIKDFLSEHE